MYVLLCAYAGGGFASSLAAEGITASCEYVNVMTETIEQGSSELFVPEHLDPLGERQIGGDDGRAAFIALGQQVKQQFTPSALERHEAQLIDDQKRDFLMALLERGEPPQIERSPCLQSTWRYANRRDAESFFDRSRPFKISCSICS